MRKLSISEKRMLSVMDQHLRRRGLSLIISPEIPDSELLSGEGPEHLGPTTFCLVRTLYPRQDVVEVLEGLRQMADGQLDEDAAKNVAAMASKVIRGLYKRAYNYIGIEPDI